MSVKSNNLKTAIFSSFSYFDVDHVFSSEMAEQHCIELHNELKTSIELLAELEAANENIIWRAPSVGDKVDAAIILKSIKSLIDDKEEEIKDIQDVLLSYCKSEAKNIFHPIMKNNNDNSECDTEIEEIDYKKKYEEAMKELNDLKISSVKTIKNLQEDSDRADENISMYKKQIIELEDKLSNNYERIKTIEQSYIDKIKNLKAVIDDLRTQKDENIEQIRQQKELDGQLKRHKDWIDRLIENKKEIQNELVDKDEEIKILKEEIKILKEDSDKADENISIYKKRIIEMNTNYEYMNKDRDYYQKQNWIRQRQIAETDEKINNLKAVIDDLRTQKDENIEQIRQQKEDANKVRIIRNEEALKLHKIIDEKNKEIFYYESKVREMNEHTKLNNN
jgi:chromosome segregation protein